VSFIWLF